MAHCYKKFIFVCTCVCIYVYIKKMTFYNKLVIYNKFEVAI